MSLIRVKWQLTDNEVCVNQFNLLWHSWNLHGEAKSRPPAKKGMWWPQTITLYSSFLVLLLFRVPATQSGFTGGPASAGWNVHACCSPFPAQSQEQGDIRKLDITWALDRAIEGHEAHSSPSICSFVWGTGGALLETYRIQQATSLHVSDQIVRNKLHEGPDIL